MPASLGPEIKNLEYIIMQTLERLNKTHLCSVYVQSLHIFEFAVKLCLKLTSGKALLTLSFLTRTIVSRKSSPYIRAHYHVSTSRSSLYHYNNIGTILFNI